VFVTERELVGGILQSRNLEYVHIYFEQFSKITSICGVPECCHLSLYIYIYMPEVPKLLGVVGPLGGELLV
jgi:hypothetical protein